MTRYLAALLVMSAVTSECPASDSLMEMEALGDGPYAVASTNIEVDPAYADIGDDAMHEYLLGLPSATGQPRFITDILKHPESAWTTDVAVPDDHALYGPASGITLPVSAFIVFPSGRDSNTRPYAFPYHDARYGRFDDMLGPGEKPRFADPNERYPLIIIAHGYAAHGLYDVQHAHSLASHGYIVAVITYGDHRTLQPGTPNYHVAALRPLLTRAVLDALLDSATFGPHIDSANIGVTGHSFGGFTALALAGGSFHGNAASVIDERVTAAVIAAPWVGGTNQDDDQFAFGADNAALQRVRIPVIGFFGTRDMDTPASTILPAMRQLSGPTYVVELVDQPHVFEDGSWEDRNNWELLFFSAYLKHDPAALERLGTTRSMRGGNEDVQLFDYQQLDRSD